MIRFIISAALIAIFDRAKRMEQEKENLKIEKRKEKRHAIYIAFGSAITAVIIGYLLTKLL